LSASNGCSGSLLLFGPDQEPPTSRGSTNAFPPDALAEMELYQRLAGDFLLVCQGLEFLEHEALRDLVRQRGAAKADESHAEHRLVKHVLRQALREPGGSRSWTHPWWRWAQSLEFEHEALQVALADSIAEVLHMGECLDRRDSNHRGQQWKFDDFRREYNVEPPHEALHDETPALIWVPSPRPYPICILPPEYPGHFEVRRVSNAGHLIINGCHRISTFPLPL
jgi:hypothetical protein